MRHDSRPLERIEKNVGLLGVVILVLVSLGGLAEITPLFVNAHTVAPAPGLRPYDALRLAGHDV
jgi:cytochrome c oxidase cbb3-type subunit 2